VIANTEYPDDVYGDVSALRDDAAKIFTIALGLRSTNTIAEYRQFLTEAHVDGELSRLRRDLDVLLDDLK
jgi:hypothetical protein